MPRAHTGFWLPAAILLAGGIVMHFFVLLAGAINGSGLGGIYFLEAATSAIQGAPATSRWTWWNICNVDGNGNNQIYSSVMPAFPFDPSTNFNGTTQGVPADFIGTNYYYLISRAAFAFNLMAIAVGVLAFFGTICLPGIAVGLTPFAVVFEGICAALMTTAFIKGRDIFNNNGMTAQIGTYAFAFLWATFFAWFLASVLLCIGQGTANRSYKRESSGGASRSSRRRSQTDSQRPMTEV